MTKEKEGPQFKQGQQEKLKKDLLSRLANNRQRFSLIENKFTLAKMKLRGLLRVAHGEVDKNEAEKIKKKIMDQYD